MRCRPTKRPSWAVEPLRVEIAPRGEAPTDMAPTYIDVYSVEPKPQLRRKLQGSAHIAVVGPTSHVDGRRAKRFSTARDIVVLVGDWPTTDQPAAWEPSQSASLVLRLALHALPRYARQEYEQEAIAILEDGCLDRAASWPRRTAWFVRNIRDLLSTGLRLRLRTKPMWCMNIWRTPDPDPDVAEHLIQQLEALLK
jgi:hypothetical protein